MFGVDSTETVAAKDAPDALRIGNEVIRAALQEFFTPKDEQVVAMEVVYVAAKKCEGGAGHEGHGPDHWTLTSRHTGGFQGGASDREKLLTELIEATEKGLENLRLRRARIAAGH